MQVKLSSCTDKPILTDAHHAHSSTTLRVFVPPSIRHALSQKEHERDILGIRSNSLFCRKYIDFCDWEEDPKGHRKVWIRELQPTKGLSCSKTHGKILLHSLDKPFNDHILSLSHKAASIREDQKDFCLRLQIGPPIHYPQRSTYRYGRCAISSVGVITVQPIIKMFRSIV